MTHVHPNVLYNYRFWFKQKHGAEWKGSDEKLREIITDVGVLSSVTEEDAEIHKSMEEFQNN